MTATEPSPGSKKGRKRPKMKVKVGDVVQLHERVRDFEAQRANPGSSERMFKDVISEVTISKVGTKYAYVGERYRPRKFDLETGTEVDGWYSGSATIHTEESLAAYMRRRDALAKLAHWTRGYGSVIAFGADKLTTEGLEKLGTLLDEEIYL